MLCVLKNRLNASACRFGTDRRGQVAMTFALAAVPLMLASGAAIDFARIATKHSSLQQATDAAVLTATKSVTPSTTSSDVQTIAQNQISTVMSDSGATVTTASLSSDRATVCISTQETVTLSVMQMFGYSSKVTSVSACAATPGSNNPNATYEIALVLDNTGSMNESAPGSSTKIAALQNAANQFISTMWSGNYAGKVKMSIVPFSGGVAIQNSDTNNRTASWIDTAGKSSWHWKTFSGAASAGFKSRFDIFNNLKAVNPAWDWAGCFETQPYPQNVNDTPPTTASPDSLYVPMLAPDEVDSNSNYYNSYIKDTHNCSGGASTDQALITQACKYKATPKVVTTNVYGPNGMCLSQPLMRMTSTQSALTAKVATLTANGDTNLHEGFMWGWRTLSPNAPFGDGRPYDLSAKPINRKIIVFMTDGFNNWSAASGTWGLSNYEAPGYYTTANGRLPATNQNITNSTQARAALDALTLEACKNARAQNIEIFTVGFSVSIDPIDTQGQNLLASCATQDGNHAFIANDANSLISAFQQIGQGLGKLRLKS
ncbi:MAG: pilus assembly protein [Beijerinckiaceae bacterium]